MSQQSYCVICIPTCFDALCQVSKHVGVYHGYWKDSLMMAPVICRNMLQTCLQLVNVFCACKVGYANYGALVTIATIIVVDWRVVFLSLCMPWSSKKYLIFGIPRTKLSNTYLVSACGIRIAQLILNLTVTVLPGEEYRLLGSSLGWRIPHPPLNQV